MAPEVKLGVVTPDELDAQMREVGRQLGRHSRS